jgi:hypothetical protein
METNPLRNDFTAGNIQGTSREHPGNIRGTFGEYSVRVERTPVSLHHNCKKHLKKVPRLTQNTTDTIREYSGNILDALPTEGAHNMGVSCRYNEISSLGIPRLGSGTP